MVDKVARKHDWGLLAIGVVFAGGGLYLALSGAGLAPSPSRLHGPNWLALAVGLVFFATGAFGAGARLARGARTTSPTCPPAPRRSSSRFNGSPLL